MGFAVNTKKSNRKNYKKEKKFNKRYAKECSECVTRKATPEELEKYFK